MNMETNISAGGTPIIARWRCQMRADGVGWGRWGADGVAEEVGIDRGPDVGGFWPDGSRT